MAYGIEREQGKTEASSYMVGGTFFLPNLEFRNRSGRYFSIAGRNVSGLFSKYPSPLQAKETLSGLCVTLGLFALILKATHSLSLSVIPASPQPAAGSPWLSQVGSQTEPQSQYKGGEDGGEGRLCFTSHLIRESETSADSVPEGVEATELGPDFSLFPLKLSKDILRGMLQCQSLGQAVTFSH